MADGEFRTLDVGDDRATRCVSGLFFRGRCEMGKGACEVDLVEYWYISVAPVPQREIF